MSPAPSSSVVQQAAHWHAQHRQGPLGMSQRDQFMEWLLASPEHLHEYLAMGHVGHALADALADEDVDALLASRPPADNTVVALPGHRRTSAAARHAAPRRRLLRWAAAACVALSTLGAAGWWSGQEQQQFSTAHGQPAQFTLSDGTTLQLDADSRVSLHFSLLHRRLDVQRGRAAFVVAEERRPLQVQAAGLRIRDIGTTFSVSLQREQARVEVLEGRVQIRAESEARLLADLSAGQSASIDYRDHHVAVRTQPAEAISAWWQGRIVFEDEALRDVVDQFNRRNARQVILDDALAGALRLSGNLRADSTDALAAYLRAQPGLELREHAGQLHVRSRPQ